MGFLFSKKRKDGRLVDAADPMLSIMPYMMRSRIEAQVSYTFSIRLDTINAFIREKRREGKRITFFHVIISALLKMIGERPHLNRFVAGRRVYQHDDFDILYVVKPDLTDESDESVARVRFEEDDTIFNVADRMSIQTEAIQNATGLKADDKIIGWVLRFPRWLLRSAFAVYRWLDFHGAVPKILLDLLPFYSSIFVSHLGTVGGDSAIHHLYEMGTCSIFAVIGKQYEKPERNDDDSINWVKAIDVTVTVDERICDGYYFVKSLKLMERYLRDPWLLEYPGINIPIKRTNEFQAFRDRERARAKERKDEAEAAQRELMEEIVKKALKEHKSTLGIDELLLTLREMEQNK